MERVFLWIGDLAYSERYPTVKRMRASLLGWRRKWVLFWRVWLAERVWGAIWRKGLRPHFFPRQYADERAEMVKRGRIPAQLEAWVWEVDGYWLGKILGMDSEYSMVGMGGNTDEEVRGQIQWIIETQYDRSGSRAWPDTGYTIYWKEGEPTEERAFTY